MFIGVYALQSGPGIPEKVSVLTVGMTYTYDGFLMPAGFYSFQDKSKTAIENLGYELEKPILKYRSESKRWPSHIFVCRSGISDEEFLYIFTIEKKSIIECFKRLAKRYPDFSMPGFTFIIAQHNSGLCLMPNGIASQSPESSQRVKGSDLNLKPGTCITKGITNPTLEQFVLIAHRAIIGTARPILFTVLADESPNCKRILIDGLKYLTYSLCHLHHNNVLGTVHVPVVLYRAGVLAKKGRNNMKTDAREPTLNPQISDYIEKLTLKLRTTLDTKFWACV